jgi:hypothetical protein
MGKKAKKPAPRDMNAELANTGQIAQQLAAAASDSTLKTNKGLIDQSLAATDTIAGKLDNSYTAAAKGQLDTAMGGIPQMQGLAARMGNLASQAEGDVNGTDIEQQLHSQALSDLALGSSLSAEQTRNAQQAGQGALASRGLAVGPAAAVAEILNRDAYAQNRLDSRRAFAGNVNQTLTSNRLQRLGLAGQLLGQSSGAYQNASQLGLQGSQAYAALDPYQRALGSNIPIASQGPSASLTGQVFGSVLNYASDLNNTNYNAAWSNYLNQQNAGYARQAGQMQAAAAKSSGNSAMMGAGIGAAGAIGGGLLASSGAGSAIIGGLGAAAIAF